MTDKEEISELMKNTTPWGCWDCDYLIDCHIEKKLRLCMNGNLHSSCGTVKVETIEIMSRFADVEFWHEGMVRGAG